MPRPPRLEEPGALHHVYARGNRKQLIVRDDVDRRTYVALLGRVIRKQGWRCLAYCLMPNHVHLVLETPAANLGDGMRRLHGDYAQTFNERHGESGHVFQGRYGSKRVTTDEQLLTLVRYVANNPVVAELCESADGWEWSSHRDTLRGPAPEWLDVQRLLGLVGADMVGDPVARYATLVAGPDGPGTGASV